MRTRIRVASSVSDTARVQQLRGLFDLPEEKETSHVWEVDLPIDGGDWSIGLIHGPSGCGKSTIARTLFPDAYHQAVQWHANHSVVDDFPESLSIKDVTALLSSVGFSSPPSWLKPFHVLSTGQQFRATCARLLADQLAHPTPGRLVVLDEYTSVVDRVVAQTCSHALQKAVRAHKLRFIAVTCHQDVIDWLQPDWTYEPAECRFTRRLLRPRPKLRLHVVRCQTQAWRLFAPHHYLTGEINRSSVCFLASLNDTPVAFSSWLPFVGQGPLTRREHRTVVLPDFQGIGIGMHLSSLIASLWKGLGYRAISTTTHPGFTNARRRSPSGE